MVHNTKFADNILCNLFKIHGKRITNEKKDTSNQTKHEKIIISKNVFIDLAFRYRSILKPILEIRNSVRRKILNLRYWEDASNYRKSNNVIYPGWKNRFQKHTEISHNQQKADEESNEDVSNQNLQASRLDTSKERSEIAKSDEEEGEWTFPEKLREQELRKKLKRMELQLTKTEYTMDDLGERRQNRNDFWETLEETKKSSYETLEALNKTEKEIILDSRDEKSLLNQKLKEYMQSPEGKIELKSEEDKMRTKILFEKWANKKGIYRLLINVFISSKHRGRGNVIRRIRLQCLVNWWFD